MIMKEEQKQRIKQKFIDAASKRWQRKIERGELSSEPRLINVLMLWTACGMTYTPTIGSSFLGNKKPPTNAEG